MTESMASWSTREVSPRRAIDYWNELLNDKILRLSVHSGHRVGFGGQIFGNALGAGRVYYIAAEHDQDARHGRASVACRDDDALCLVHMRAGAFRLDSAAREADLGVGDCILLDSKERFRFRLPERSASLVLRFSSSWMRRWLPRYEDFTARRIPGDQGWGRTLSNALQNLAPESVDGLALSGGDMVDQVGGLLALACGPRRHSSSRTRALRQRLVTTIREHAAEPGLDPGTVAARLGISKRYVHKLLAADNTTFGTVLYAERVRIARNLLAAGGAGTRTFAEVAAAAGFADASHLRRRLAASRKGESRSDHA